MSSNNVVFLRLPEETLAQVDNLIQTRKIKNRQDLIKEAISWYLDTHDKMRDTLKAVNAPSISLAE